MSERMPPPDFLRRFTPTPYVFELWVGENSTRIEADDLEIALAIRHACRIRHIGTEQVRYWRLIRDVGTSVYGVELAVFETGELKTLFHRSGTLLIADVEKREVFGFIGTGLGMCELTDNLLPHLCAHPLPRSGSGPFTNK